VSGQFGPLVHGSWLAGHIDDPDLRVIDFRWYLDGRSGRAAYDSGHVPRAVFVDLDAEVTGRQQGQGRHPLPGREQFELAMRRAGVCTVSRVVVYDDLGGFSAARLWWLLRYFGHQAVAVLDGGLQAWPNELSTAPESPAEGDFEATPAQEHMKLDYEALRRPLAGSADRSSMPLAGRAAEGVSRLVLLDARSPERFRGEVEPIDPRAGHIPGARNRPWQANLDERKRFLAPDRLRREFEALGVVSGPEAVAYCGSGVSACHTLLALELAGLTAGRLYPGSWSDWSTRAEAPAATG
jgi:thiosulfate/3-mercaptopyruvate sulfurtransferase